MSSVWYEEMDRAILSYIKKHITILDRKTNKRVPCPCKVRLPEEDGEIGSKPCITIAHIGEIKDYNRYNWQGYYKTSSSNSKELRLPKKYNISFQVDLWTNYARDMNDLTIQWVDKFDNLTSLPVIDNEGQEVLCEISKNGFYSNAYTDKEERTFQSSYTYTLWVTIDEDQDIFKDVAQKIKIHTTKKV